MPVNDRPTVSLTADPDRPGMNSTTAPDEPSTRRERSPVSAGRYELLDEIARGGMGVVYRAVDAALNREVAVKVLQERFAPDSGTARRFFDEARIAAQLQHPGIPPVHDLGTLEDGRPFLAMKLIKGRTLEELLRERTDSAQDRGRFVAAFEQIAHALAYAHAQRVIHRDLKPANVMVGGFGEVQVMDWGLAKVLTHQPRPGDGPEQTGPETEIKSLRESDGSLTQAGSVLGTPAFMPPEQAVGAIGKVDARSDVFGLGAILAVILTGEPPFGSGSAEKVRVKAAQGDLAECFGRLQACGAEPELIALCQRCLAAKPADRPADAGEVAKAVAGLRVAAEERARQAEVERERATVREVESRKRRRVWLGLAGVLALGLVVAVVLAIRADDARRAAQLAEKDAEDRRTEAETAKQKAEAETELANAVKTFLQRDVLQLADPRTQRQDGKLEYNADVKLRDVVLRASQAIEGQFADRPLIEAELRWTLGYTLYGMGRSDLAVPHYERMRAIYTRLNGDDHPDTLTSMSNLAISYSNLGRRDEALKLNEEILALRKKKLGPDHPDTLWSMNNLALSYAELGRRDEALKLNEETLALRRQKLGPDHPDTLLSMNSLASSYSYLGRRDEALKLREETLGLRKKKLGPDHPDTLASMNNLANSYAALDRHDEALKLREETFALRKKKLDPDHPDMLASMNNLAISYANLGRRDEALKLIEETFALYQKKLGPDHPDTLQSMNNLAACYTALDRHDEALKLNEENLALRRQKLGPDHPGTLFSTWAVISSRMDLKQFDQALPEIDALLRLADRAAAAGKRPDPRLRPAMIQFRLRVFAARKDPEGYRESVEMYERLGLKDADGLYSAACSRAVLSGLLPDRPEEAKREADRAMDWLRQAVAAGWKEHAHMLKDSDLDPLRGREDFQALMAELKERVTPELLPRPRER